MFTGRCFTPDPPGIVRTPCHVATRTLTSNFPQKAVCIEIVKQGSSEELGPKPGREDGIQERRLNQISPEKVDTLCDSKAGKKRVNKTTRKIKE